MSYFDPECIQCRAIRRPCHWHRMTADDLARWADHEAAKASRRLAREHPNASYLPNERGAIARVIGRDPGRSA